ncbi:MAG: ABC transporter permease subunit [bacterium]|nr:ABC transporter permease subunit [bacterium]
MNSLIALTKKEFGQYFHTPIAFIFIVVFLTAANWLFFQNYFLVGQASLRNWFEFLPWLLVFLIPALTMRLWAEEKKAGTIEALLTLPVTETTVVAGKFLGSILFYLVCLAFSLPLVAIVANTGSLDFGQVVGQYLGAFLLGAGLISVGLFISCLTSNQIVAFIGAAAACFVLIVLGSQMVQAIFPPAIAPYLNLIGFDAHYRNLGRGLIDLRDVIFFLSAIGVFLYANIKNLESRFWQ